MNCEARIALQLRPVALHFPVQKLFHAAAQMLAHLEGIIPALESAHAVHEAVRRAPAAKDQLFIINLSGRGDKDTDIYRENLKELDEPDQNRPAL